MIIIVTTLHQKNDAARIGKGLLNEHLIACYNLWPVESAYWWKGELLEESETIMIMKTKNENFEPVRKFIKEKSGYEVPEVIALSAKDKDVDKSYLNWVEKETKWT